MLTEMKDKPLPENLQKYLEKFQHLPPLEEFKMGTAMLDREAKIALYRNKPVKRWAEHDPNL